MTASMGSMAVHTDYFKKIAPVEPVAEGLGSSNQTAISVKASFDQRKDCRVDRNSAFPAVSVFESALNLLLF